MNTILMHKDKKVIAFERDKRGVITQIGEIYDKDLLPCYIGENLNDMKLGLQMWLLERNISKTRKDIEPLIAFYGVESFKSKAKISLFDCYWLKINEEDNWDTLNPYKNWESEDDGYFNLVHDPCTVPELDINSPNLTLSGVQKRFWYKKDGKLGIITESAQKDMAIYKTAKSMGLENLVEQRDYIIILGTIYSYKPVLTSEKIERIPFSLLYDSIAQDENKKVENLEMCCKKYGLKGWKDFFGGILELDKKIGNKERSLCEIGVYRDTNTLKIKGFEKI